MLLPPIISIIVPCYNQEIYLKDALDSVLDQTLENWECIIVNDGSIDNSEQVALGYCKHDDRFKYVKKKNGGVSSARNLGVEFALGKYILPLDADDTIGTTYLEKAITILDNNPLIKLVYCKARMYGQLSKDWLLHPFDYEKLLKGHNMIFNSSVFRRTDFINVGGYSENMRYGWEDWDFWIRLLNKCNHDQVHRIDDFLFNYRIKDISRSVDIDQDKCLQFQMQNQSLKNNIDIYIQHYPDLFQMIVNQDYNKNLLNKQLVKLGVKLHFLIQKAKRIFTKGLL